MSLEILANELLLELFEYLDAVELFRAFHNVNSRFNTLLLIHLRAYRINFQSVLKYQSDIICRQYLPSIVGRVISLRLSNNDDESGPQTHLFFFSGLLLNQFTHLRSLSLCYIDFLPALYKLMVDCRQLPHLTHLKVIQCHVKYMSSVDFSNIIWSLPKLTHCRLDIQDIFLNPTIVSSSLEWLSISCRSFGLSQMIDLSQKTSALRYLHVPLNNLNDEPHQTLYFFLSITMLKLSYVRSSHAMMSILQVTPNLTHLKIDTYHINCDGYRWEELIDNYLPKLTNFHLRMHMRLYGEDNNEKHVEGLVDSFRTRFWLEKHQWFIGCHHMSSETYSSIVLYTMPYGFVDVHSNTLTVSYTTTCPKNVDHGTYHRVKNLGYSLSLPTYYLSFKRFPNIRKLSINLYFNVNICRDVPIFYQLTSITILSVNEDGQLHLQALLDRAPNLYSLTIKSWPSFQLPLVQNTNTSLRRIDLRMDTREPYCSFYSAEACETLIHSPLGMQCEELLIKLKSYENTLALVNGMHNLRMLHISYQIGTGRCSLYNLYEKESKISLDWLHNHLPRTCAISKCSYDSSLWIVLEKP